MSKTPEERIADYLKTGEFPAFPSQHFIHGEWKESRSKKTMETFDPGTGQAFASFAAGCVEDVEEAVSSSEKALQLWRKIPPVERCSILHRAGYLTRKNLDFLSMAETVDSGKTLAEARTDVMEAARFFEYYAGLADKIYGDTIPLSVDKLSMTIREPVGIVAHIVPWNYPISTNIRGVAPCLAAGCTAIVKPAETAPVTALLLADILKEAGLPDGVYNVVTGTGQEVGAPLVAYSKIHHITFTGSVATGIGVAKNAADNVTPLTLELGGKSPLIALSDCDVSLVAEGVLTGIFSNAGQICSASSRLIVERKIHEELMEAILRETKKIRVGHGLKPTSNMGAINNPNQLQKIDTFVQDAKKRDCSVLAGGHIVHDEECTGWFYAPTIIDDLSSDDILVREEIFGPVLSVQIAESSEEALSLANRSKYGLVAGVYTQDISEALSFAKQLDCGQVNINDYWASTQAVPFGGNKFSGYGREKGVEGVRAYTKTKSITIKL